MVLLVEKRFKHALLQAKNKYKINKIYAYQPVT